MFYDVGYQKHAHKHPQHLVSSFLNTFIRGKIVVLDAFKSQASSFVASKVQPLRQSRFLEYACAVFQGLGEWCLKFGRPF